MRSEACNQTTAELLEQIRTMKVGSVNLMEVCGTHTMAIAKSGIRQMLPENVKLLSGPGCPVCVTPAAVMDEILRLSERSDVIVTTYGDLIRVPGSVPGDNLIRRRAQGARVEMVYSPLDAVKIAEENPDKEVIFLGAGFETTAPGTAIALMVAEEKQLNNFSILSMLKSVEPALRALMADEQFNVQGFLCPGHVATIIGETGFAFLPEEYKMPAVISGFEPEDILLSVHHLLKQLEEQTPKLENTYERAVMPQGNPLAMATIDQYLELRDDLWRGLGKIPKSGFGIRKEYEKYDAEWKFSLTFPEKEGNTACRCGEVIQGRMSPRECPLFGTVCVPEEPVGPCMVSSEGACAAAYKYQEV